MIDAASREGHEFACEPPRCLYKTPYTKVS
jgi:hypothetical protein